MPFWEQANAIQVAREYMFRTSTLPQHLWRSFIAPYLVMLVCTFIGVFLVDHQTMYFLPVVFVSGLIGWGAEQLLYHRMISKGIDVFLDDYKTLRYRRFEFKDMAAIIHRCGVPPE